jgi:hypothetical protein
MKTVLLLTVWWATLVSLAAIAWSPGGRPPKGGASKWRKIKFWLTTHRDCGWCKRRIHTAPFPRPYELTRGFLVPAVTHTICPKCLASVVRELKKPTDLRVERAMHETRRKVLEKILNHAV